MANVQIGEQAVEGGVQAEGGSEAEVEQCRLTAHQPADQADLDEVADARQRRDRQQTQQHKEEQVLRQGDRGVGQRGAAGAAADEGGHREARADGQRRRRSAGDALAQLLLVH